MQDYQNVGPSAESLPPMYVNSAAVHKEKAVLEKKMELKQALAKKLELTQKVLKPVITVTVSEGYTDKASTENVDKRNESAELLQEPPMKEPVYAQPIKTKPDETVVQNDDEKTEVRSSVTSPAPKMPSTIEEMTRDQINRAFRAGT